jgi:hypothetical protein
MPRGQTAKQREPEEGAPEGEARPLVSSEPLDVQSLRGEVRDALLGVLRSAGSPAMAVASAGRTLLEMMREEAENPSNQRPLIEMSAADIDEEIEHYKKAWITKTP